MKKKNILILTISVSLSFFLIYYFFSIKHDKTKMVFEVKKPTKQNIQQFISATGTVQAKEHIIIGSLVEGKAIKIYVENNDFVKKGDLLVELDNGIGDTNVKKTKAILLEAQANETYQKKYYQRQKELFINGQISQNSFDLITRDYQLAKAKVFDAKATLEKEESLFKNLNILSPVDGIIISKKVNIGQMVTSKLDVTPLFEIAKDLKKMEVNLDVDEADIGIVKNGHKVHCKIDAFANKIITLTVNKIEYQVKKVDNIVSYLVLLNLENSELVLRPGMTVSADIEVANTVDSLAVPNKAFRINSINLKKYAKEMNYEIKEFIRPETSFGNKDTLWIKEGYSLEEVPVEIGAYNRKFSEIKNGISENDLIVTNFIQEKDSSSFLKKFFGTKVGG